METSSERQARLDSRLREEGPGDRRRRRWFARTTTRAERVWAWALRIVPGMLVAAPLVIAALVGRRWEPSEKIVLGAAAGAWTIGWLAVVIVAGIGARRVRVVRRAMLAGLPFAVDNYEAALGDDPERERVLVYLRRRDDELQFTREVGAAIADAAGGGWTWGDSGCLEYAPPRRERAESTGERREVIDRCLERLRAVHHAHRFVAAVVFTD